MKKAIYFQKQCLLLNRDARPHEAHEPGILADNRSVAGGKTATASQVTIYKEHGNIAWHVLMKMQHEGSHGLLNQSRFDCAAV